MKKYIFALILILIATTVFAAGYLGRDKDKNLVQDFMPSVFGLLEATKADMTLDVTTYHAVRLTPTVAVTYKLNGTGTAAPIAANATQELRIPASVTSLVFSAASSASNKVWYQAQ